MSDVRPRAVAHRGSVIATGFVIDARVTGEREARRRVLALWRPGAAVSARGQAYVVTGLAARRVRVDEAPGAPLVDDGGLRSAAPLTAAERGQLEERAPSGSVVLVEGGVALAWRPRAEDAVDVAAWLDLDDAAVVTTAPLAPAPVVATIPVVARIDLRAAVGVGEVHGGAAGLRAALDRAEASVEPTSWWQRLTGWLAARTGRARGPTAAAALPAGEGAPIAPASEIPDEPAPRPPGWRARWRARMSERLWTSWFGSVLGRRHGRYLGDTLDLFDRGELDEALRRALPLGGSGTAEDAGPAVGVPAPRAALTPSTAKAKRSSYVPLPMRAGDLLRQRYRQAIERLLREGRVEEAAFVHADLLGELAAAVDLLERHRKFGLAARLAEGHGLDPALVTRLWFLAGDRARAVAVARRHHAWAAALAWLERHRDPRADDLRWAWAEHLARSSAYADAVETAWPLTARRDELRPWIERGLELDDARAAGLAVTALVLAPERFAALWPRFATILDDPTPDGRWRRRALYQALTRPVPPAPVRTLARAAVRALWRDGADRSTSLLEPRLLTIADDPALRADRPPLADPQASPARASQLAPPPRVHRWGDADVGQVAITDAALLPGGRRLLVALGELGARLVGVDGRVRASFEEPASELVVSDHGASAIALARRDRHLRMTRLDLVERAARAWTVAECDGGASTYDGDVWLTWRGGEVLAIDALAPGWKALWGVDTRSAIRGIDRAGDRFAVITAAEVWRHERMVLRARDELRRPSGDAVLLRVQARRADGSTVALVGARGDGPPALRVVTAARSIDLGPGRPCGFESGAVHAAIATRTERGLAIAIVDHHVARVTAMLELEGATVASLRIVDEPGTLTVADDRGRLIVVDPSTGAVRIDLRLRA